MYRPLDVRCPMCGAPPGRRCSSLVLHDRPVLRRAHADRITSARRSSIAVNAARRPATVSDAWTCPHCGRSYWAPKEWERELADVVRRAAQEMHGRWHAEEEADTGRTT